MQRINDWNTQGITFATSFAFFGSFVNVMAFWTVDATKRRESNSFKWSYVELYWLKLFQNDCVELQY